MGYAATLAWALFSPVWPSPGSCSGRPSTGCTTSSGTSHDRYLQRPRQAAAPAAHADARAEADLPPDRQRHQGADRGRAVHDGHDRDPPRLPRPAVLHGGDVAEERGDDPGLPGTAVPRLTGHRRDRRPRPRGRQRHLPRRRGARPGAGPTRPAGLAVPRPRGPRWPADRVGGELAPAGTQLHLRAADQQLHRGVGADGLPHPAAQHRGDRGHRDAGHPHRLDHGRLRPGPLPAALQAHDLRGADRHDHPAPLRHPGPHLRAVLPDRLGRDLAAAGGAALLRQRLQRVPAAPVLPDAAQGPG